MDFKRLDICVVTIIRMNHLHMNGLKYTWVAACCFFLSPLIGQRFQGGLKMAGTLSQIDGDDIYGFHKPGFELGGFVAAKLSDKTALETGIQYSVRGSLSSKNDLLRVSIGLQYIDVPLVFVIRDWIKESAETDYYQMEFFGGISGGRLIGSSSYTGVDKEFKKNDLSWLLGTSFYWSENWGATAKYTRSFTSLYTYSKNGGFIDMTSYYLSLGLKYKFN